MWQIHLGGSRSQSRSVRHRQPLTVLCLPKPTCTPTSNRPNKLTCYFYRGFSPVTSTPRSSTQLRQRNTGEELLHHPRMPQGCCHGSDTASSEKNIGSPATSQHRISRVEEQGKPLIVSFQSGSLQKAACKHNGMLPYVSCCPTPILHSFWSIFGAIPFPCLAHPVPSQLRGTEQKKQMERAHHTTELVQSRHRQLEPPDPPSRFSERKIQPITRKRMNQEEGKPQAESGQGIWTLSSSPQATAHPYLHVKPVITHKPTSGPSRKASVLPTNNAPKLKEAAGNPFGAHDLLATGAGKKG